VRIAIVGSGYVGLVTGVCLSDLGHEVVLVDNDSAKLAALQRGDIPIHEKFLPELLQRHRGRRLLFSGELALAARNADAVFIAVGTPPTDQGDADLSYVESVARDISGSITGYKLVVEKSTVPVYTSGWIRRIMLRNGAKADSFDVASNPEFLREGSAVTDFLYPDRIVAGADTDRASELLRQIYEPLTSGRYYSEAHAVPRPENASTAFPQLMLTSAKSAELIKHASNAFLAMKISFANAVATVCESVGADAKQVCQGIGSDARIGPRFLNPGLGYGGSCFPKDLLAFRSVARECGIEFRLLDEVIRINEEQRQRFLRKVRSALWTLRGKRLGVLGLAFKGGTDDIRESPAILTIQALLQEGSNVVAHDPAAMARAQEVLPASVEYAASPYEAARGADALLILTEWEEYSQLDLARLAQEMKYPIVIDGRNLYDGPVMTQHGFTYYSVGRATAVPEEHAASLPQGSAERKA
jgi:UDPglucose 6-dehydrogenase